MYIRKIVSKNLGPIKKIQLLLPLENGVPKPVVLVGENGTGKSTLISNVVDSFYEIAGAAYPDARKHGETEGYEFYKIINPIEIHIGEKYLYSYIKYESLSGEIPSIDYVFKSGRISNEEFRQNCDDCSQQISWTDDENFKQTSVPFQTLFMSVVLFVVIPLAAGIITRLLVVRKKGTEYFEQTFLHKFDSATTVGLLLTLILIFMFQGEVVLDNPLHIILIAVPLIIQTFFIFFLAFGVCRIIRLPYDIAAPAGMIGASNFFELAVAVAVALFGTSSPAALATTVGVLTEVPVMLTLVKIANKLKEKFKYE